MVAGPALSVLSLAADGLQLWSAGWQPAAVALALATVTLSGSAPEPSSSQSARAGQSHRQASPDTGTHQAGSDTTHSVPTASARTSTPSCWVALDYTI